jgi:transcription initiation factor TFIID subunit TAF12
MKKLTLFLLFALSSTSAIFAQDYKGAENRAFCHTQRMTKELYLTDIQKKRVNEVNVKIYKKTEDLRIAIKDRDQLLKSTKELDIEQNNELEKVLDASQLFTYERIKTKQSGTENECLIPVSATK